MGVSAIFLDRDGVINKPIIRGGKPYPPTSIDQVELIPEIVCSLHRLGSIGYVLIGTSNQPDVARGTMTREMVEAINLFIQSKLPMKEILVCYHDDMDLCECRKPKPGLILQGAQKYGVDLSKSWMVGDRWKDIAAGQAAGLKTIFIDYHYDEDYRCSPADITLEDISLLAEVILNSQNETS